MDGLRHTHVYVVCRIDRMPRESASSALAPDDLKPYFTVTKVFYEAVQAEQEVTRLNELATSRECDSLYFWQVGRVPID